MDFAENCITGAMTLERRIGYSALGYHLGTNEPDCREGRSAISDGSKGRAFELPGHSPVCRNLASTFAKSNCLTGARQIGEFAL